MLGFSKEARLGQGLLNSLGQLLELPWVHVLPKGRCPKLAGDGEEEMGGLWEGEEKEEGEAWEGAKKGRRYPTGPAKTLRIPG